MSLVKGFTDVLTPENRLTCPTFNRGGGLGNTVTYSSLSTGSNTAICSGWNIRPEQTGISDVTVVRSYNKLNITFTISIGDSGSPYVIIRNTNAKPFVVNMPTTYAYKIKLLSTTSNRPLQSIISASDAGTQRTEYFNQEYLEIGKEIECVKICQPTSAILGFGIRFPNLNNQTVTVNFEISDCRLFIGKYTDPPLAYGNEDIHNYCSYNYFTVNSYTQAMDDSQAIAIYDDLGCQIVFKKLQPNTGGSLAQACKVNDLCWFTFPSTAKKILKFRICRFYTSANVFNDLYIKCFGSPNGAGSTTHVYSFISYFHFVQASSTALGTVTQRVTDLFKGTSALPITLSIEHHTGYYSCLYATVDVRNWTRVYPTKVMLDIESMFTHNTLHANPFLYIEDVTPA